jgi:hypothetical protein
VGKAVGILVGRDVVGVSVGSSVGIALVGIAVGYFGIGQLWRGKLCGLIN